MLGVEVVLVEVLARVLVEVRLGVVVLVHYGQVVARCVVDRAVVVEGSAVEVSVGIV